MFETPANWTISIPIIFSFTPAGQWLYYRVLVTFFYYIRYQYQLYNVPEIYLITVLVFRLNYLQKEHIGNILNVNEKKRYRPKNIQIRSKKIQRARRKKASNVSMNCENRSWENILRLFVGKKEFGSKWLCKGRRCIRLFVRQKRVNRNTLYCLPCCAFVNFFVK